MGKLFTILFHLFMISITGGFWILILLIMAATNKHK